MPSRSCLLTSRMRTQRRSGLAGALRWSRSLPIELDETPTPKAQDDDSFVSTIVENLQTAGVQNTFRGERLSFDTLEPYASDGLLHAHGTITDADGEVRTVAIMIGPEHGTVSPDMVKDAAREALKGAGFDILVVCGFAFEAYASETAKEFAPSGTASLLPKTSARWDGCGYSSPT